MISNRVKPRTELIDIVLSEYYELKTYHSVRCLSCSLSPKLIFRRQVHSTQQNDPKYEKTHNSDAHYKMEISPAMWFFHYNLIFTGIAERIIIYLRMGRTSRHSGYHGGMAIGISEGMLTYYSNGSHFCTNFGLIICIKSICSTVGFSVMIWQIKTKIFQKSVVKITQMISKLRTSIMHKCRITQGRLKLHWKEWEMEIFQIS